VPAPREGDTEIRYTKRALRSFQKLCEEQGRDPKDVERAVHQAARDLDTTKEYTCVACKGTFKPGGRMLCLPATGEFFCPACTEKAKTGGGR
jgi:hypothetical protein